MKKEANKEAPLNSFKSHSLLAGRKHVAARRVIVQPLSDPPRALRSNPMAAMDATLLALSGVGLQGGKRFGFASCERRVGASEGMNVLKVRARIVSTLTERNEVGKQRGQIRRPKPVLYTAQARQVVVLRFHTETPIALTHFRVSPCPSDWPPSKHQSEAYSCVNESF